MFWDQGRIFFEFCGLFFVFASGLLVSPIPLVGLKTSMYKELPKDAVFSFIRLQVANALSNTAAEWCRVFSEYPSLSSFQVVTFDQKMITKNYNPPAGSLFLLEQSMNRTER